MNIFDTAKTRRKVQVTNMEIPTIPNRNVPYLTNTAPDPIRPNLTAPYQTLQQ